MVRSFIVHICTCIGDYTLSVRVEKDDRLTWANVILVDVGNKHDRAVLRGQFKFPGPRATLNSCCKSLVIVQLFDTGVVRDSRTDL